MLNMTYAPSDQAMADRIRNDLATVPLKLDRRLLIVLASPASMQDDSVLQSVKEAASAGTHIAVIKVKPVEVAAGMGEFPPLDVSTTYDRQRLVRYLNRVDLGAARLRRNRLLLLLVSGAAMLMFAVGIWGITSGQVAFPVDEYATEYAFELNEISTFAAPTLEYLMPRTTDDALNYAATVQEMPMRVREFAIETATALNLDQETFSTRAAATSISMTQQSGEVTATP